MAETVRIGPMALQGEFEAPPGACGIVVFAHGSGSGLGSPRNRHVAEVLHGHRLATLQFDLLTAAEADDRSNVFDIGLLSERLGEAIEWLHTRPQLDSRRVGLFGASTGAAAALRTAAEHPAWVAAVVSRGGRPDLALEALPLVRAPTLLICGGHDPEVLALNRRALQALRGRKRLEIVPGATHLFEEPGALDSVAQLAAAWFSSYLPDGL